MKDKKSNNENSNVLKNNKKNVIERVIEPLLSWESARQIISVGTKLAKNSNYRENILYIKAAEKLLHNDPKNNAAFYLLINALMPTEMTRESETENRILFHFLNQANWNYKINLYDYWIDKLEIYSRISNPLISVVIVTCNNNKNLEENIIRIKRQCNGNGEIIFVNNGLENNNILKILPFVNKYIKNKKNSGACIARNMGALLSEADIVLFVDDDGIPDDYLVVSHYEAHMNKNIVAVRGVYLPDDHRQLPPPFYFLGQSIRPAPMTMEGNTSFKKSPFFESGGWPDDFLVYGEGKVISYRLMKIYNGINRQIYIPYAVLWHNAFQNERERRTRAMQIHNATLLRDAKYPDLKSTINVWGDQVLSERERSEMDYDDIVRDVHKALRENGLRKELTSEGREGPQEVHLTDIREAIGQFRLARNVGQKSNSTNAKKNSTIIPNDISTQQPSQVSVAHTKRVRIFTGTLCNVRCRFCYYIKKKDLWDDVLIQRQMDLAKQEGIENIDFSGGESSVLKNWFEHLEYAKRLGFKQICTITNGLRFADKDFLKKSIESGLNEILFSVHGYDEKSHDWLTRCSGAYRQLIRGIENAKLMGVPFRINTTVYRQNVAKLVDIAKLVKILEPFQYNFILFNYWSTAGTTENEMAIKYSDAAPYVKEAINILQDSVPYVNARYMPFCLMDGYEKHVCNYPQKIFDPFEWSQRVLPLLFVKDFVKTPTLYKSWLKNMSNKYALKLKRYFECENRDDADDLCVLIRRSDYAKKIDCYQCKNDLICDGVESQYAKSKGVNELKRVYGKRIDNPMNYRMQFYDGYERFLRSC